MTSSLSGAEVATDSHIDVVSPNVARIYNAYAGGAQSFGPDRDFAREAASIFPAIFDGVLDNRNFLRRSVAAMAAAGISQFLDLGAGIPMPGNVREIARRYCSTARVISVDNEPVAVASNRGDFLGDANALAIFDDLRSPEDILRRRDVQDLFDLNEPIGVLLGAVLHFIPPADDPAGIVQRYVREIPAGSWVAISHGSMDAASDEQRDELARFADKYRDSKTPLYLRDHDDVVRFFTGLVMVSPYADADEQPADQPGGQTGKATELRIAPVDGVVHLPDWRPDEPAVGEQRTSKAHRCAWCGVGRKPPA